MVSAPTIQDDSACGVLSRDFPYPTNQGRPGTGRPGGGFYLCLSSGANSIARLHGAYAVGHDELLQVENVALILLMAKTSPTGVQGGVSRVNC